MGYILGILASTPILFAGLNKPASANFVQVILAFLLAWLIAFLWKRSTRSTANSVRQMFLAWTACVFVGMVAWSFIDQFRK